MYEDETGPQFEKRALAAAKAIHNPLGTQGPVMHRGREIDAAFEMDDAIHVYEFTVRRDKAKAIQDASKIRELLIDLHRKPENAYKSVTGWVVTRDEPTAEQRGAVRKEAEIAKFPIHAISMATLSRRLCDSESYIQCRDRAPFGSIAYVTNSSRSSVNVETIFSDIDGKEESVKGITKSLSGGNRHLIIGDFGVGKSHALRQIYMEMRKAHFKSDKLTPFPVHVNLRDCAGLKTPAEILRRHSEEVGFSNDRALTSAWRAGACVLLLDGFDEIVPTRWMGSAADVKQVRFQALSGIRRLIEEAPEETGIAVCGRAHFFSSAQEMISVLGLSEECSLQTIHDFTNEQVVNYLKKSGINWSVPEWLPTRPLLIGYLLADGAMYDVESDSLVDQAAAWRNLFGMICKREAKMFSAVRPEKIKQLVSRVATLARSTGDETGPVDMKILSQAFREVNGVEADEEGIQLLLRLPGLANPSAANLDLNKEQRVFVDKDLADTAYGEDLASYLAQPHEGHTLAQNASWVVSSSELGVGVAAQSLELRDVSAGTVLAAAKRRQDKHQYDAVLTDALRVADYLAPEKVRQSFIVEGVMIESLTPSDSNTVLSKINFHDSVIHRLDISSLESEEACPVFRSCLIGLLDGAAGVPVALAEKFIDCEFESFSSLSQTTVGIMQLKLSDDAKIALTVLKKIYSQRGSGRKESGLSRGLDPAIRGRVPAVLTALQSQGWIHRIVSGREPIYVGVKEKRAYALRILEEPNRFNFEA
ncbi:NACHT domain-containing protein [Streptomyces sp. MBT65]|uniref:NACHT domain-containing protein n=1 Tax=Streptomyces sp. MBT65 TaxID=1488395 RepID=UPI00190A4747|nr:NACHT domain-containing protein [Streptomyces sp. MBT65]MBK3578552.1 NACHT domain-containing protein [Streptomyces sp. MBT65]